MDANTNNIVDILAGGQAVQVEVSVNNDDLVKIIGSVFVAVLLAGFLSKAMK